MSRTLEFRPDLDECFLEDRPLLAPVVPTLPWLMITGSSSFVSLGGGGGGSGGGLSNLSPLPGPPVMIVGGLGSLYGSGVGGSAATSVTAGTLFSYYGMGYGQRGVGPSGSVVAGSGANERGGGGGAPSGNTIGYGATINSGFGFSLNALNGYGMGPSMSALGQTTSSGGTVASPNQAAAQEETPPPDTGNATGVANTGAPMIGVDVRPQDNLLRGVRVAPPATGAMGR